MSATLHDRRIANGMRAQMELRQKLLDGGAKQIGWKVGLGAPAMQAQVQAHRADRRLSARPRRACLRAPVSLDRLAEAGRRGGDRRLHRSRPAGRRQS
jgi:hypothetical protein